MEWVGAAFPGEETTVGESGKSGRGQGLRWEWQERGRRGEARPEPETFRRPGGDLAGEGRPWKGLGGE